MRITPASLSLQLCFLQLKKTGEAMLRVTLWGPANSLFGDRKNKKIREKEGKSCKKGKGWVFQGFTLTAFWWRECFPSFYSQWAKLHHANWPLPSFVRQVPGPRAGRALQSCHWKGQLSCCSQRNSSFSEFMASESKQANATLTLQ